MLFKFVTLATIISATAAQSPAYGQCGGQGWSGSSTCVSGYTCKAQSQYYSQCLPGSGKSLPTPQRRISLTMLPGGGGGGSNPTTTVRTTTSSAKPANTGGSSSGGNGKSYSASFTQYGSTDTWGSGNCQTKSTACGFYTQGYNAAVSQNVFGVGPVRGSSQRLRCKPSANILSTGCRCGTRLRHVLEAHNPERQLRPQSQQRGQ